MSIGFVGYGRFGSCLAQRFLEAGVPVRAFDPSAHLPAQIAAGSPTEVAISSETVILSVPVGSIGGALRDLRPHLTPAHLVLDVASVKIAPIDAMAAILGPDVPFAGTHPLFGPLSIAREERPLRVVICPHPLHAGAASRAAALFASIGCETTELEAGAHDRIMAETHAVTYFLAKGILDARLRFDSALAPPSAKAVARAVEAVREDAGHLFVSLHRSNPYSAEARSRLLESLAAADHALRSPSDGDGPSAPADLDIPDLPEPSPLLREAREEIDELDDQLLVLLARRTRAALRAAEVKQELNRPVRDTRREEMLLQSRRRRAIELGLDAGGVERVFEAILRFSRAVQAGAARPQV